MTETNDQTTPATDEAAEYTEPQTRYAAAGGGFILRAAGTAVVCLVLGVWGIYDYVWSIPAREQAAQRAETSRNVKASLDGLDAGATGPLVGTTIEDIDLDLAKPESDPLDAQEASWRESLLTFRDALERPSTMSPTDHPLLQVRARELADAGLELYGDVTPPSSYDRPVQWMFILCLLFVPWYVWVLVVTGSKKYRLDPDGTLHMPEGVWSHEDLADIDMHRWMAKSTCWVVGPGGMRVKLDAHIYKGLDVIIGVIAHEKYPTQWTLDARPVKKDETTSSTKAEAADAQTQD